MCLPCGVAGGACCAASCACSALTACCGCDSVKPSSGHSSRAPYVFFIAIAVLLSIVVRLSGGKFLDKIEISDAGSMCSSNACLANLAIIRLSFALAVFFTVMLLVSFSSVFSKFNRSFWGLKFLFFLILVVGSFVIPVHFYDVYSLIARYTSGVYLLLQIIVLIDFAYNWNASWVSKESTKFLVALLVMSGLLIIGSIVGWAFMFLRFSGDHCQLQTFFVSFTIVLCGIFTILSISEFVEHGALFPSAVVTAYNTYLLFSSLTSDPSQCNTLIFQGESNPTAIGIGLFITVISLTYSSWSLSSKASAFRIHDKDSEVDPETLVKTEAEVDTEEEEEEDPRAFRANQYFHFIRLTLV